MTRASRASVSRPSAARRSAARYLIAGLISLGLCIAGGLLIALLGNGPLAVDDAWQHFVRSHQSPLLAAVSLWLNDAGAQTYLAFVLPAIAGIVLLLARRPLPAGAILTGGLVGPLAVTLLKAVLQRPRPVDPDIVVTLTAYPSGHVSNLVVLLVLVGLALHRRWWWPVAVVLTIAMAFSRTYLDSHWITDTIGGVLLGSGLALVLWSGVLRLEHPMRNGSSPSATKRR